MRKITIGADPEIFITRKGKFFSAHNQIKGTKAKPFSVPGGAIQVDGVAAEFNIDPAETPDEFVGNVARVLNYLKGELMLKGFEPAVQPVATFDPRYFRKLPGRALALGCEPDFNAWTGEVNAVEPPNEPIRTGAGHIHIGWTSGADPFETEHFNDCRAIVKQLDYYLGIYSLLWDDDPTRRKVYGQAGAFRPKPYGVEYRVLSNAWVENQYLQRWIFNSVLKALSDLEKGDTPIKDYGEVAQMVINENQTHWPTFLKWDSGVGDVRKLLPIAA